MENTIYAYGNAYGKHHLSSLFFSTEIYKASFTMLPQSPDSFMFLDWLKRSPLA